jgi:hypothetical protein
MRQCVESLTVVELGMIDKTLGDRLLEDFSAGKSTHGELRMSLEKNAWSRYGTGLWNEPWSEYFSELSRAVQPYSHCGNELLQWGIHVISGQDDVLKGEERLLASAFAYDPIKASRITLYHSLLLWTLARLTAGNRPDASSTKVSDQQISEWGEAIGRAKLWIQKGNWSTQFWPHMLFKH